MNYAAHYDRLIARARSRVMEGYRERHHVLPKCMGGGNEPENLVELTAEEHYVAHQLLVKMYPRHGGLAWSALRLAKHAVNHRAYGWLRRRYSLSKRSKEHCANIGRAQLGRPTSPETRANMSVAKRGIPQSVETRAKISASLRGNMNSRGRVRSVETRARMSAAHRGKTMGPLSLETRAKIAAAKKGKKHIGHPITPEIWKKALATKRANRLLAENKALDQV